MMDIPDSFWAINYEKQRNDFYGFTEEEYDGVISVEPDDRESDDELD